MSSLHTQIVSISQVVFPFATSLNLTVWTGDAIMDFQSHKTVQLHHGLEEETVHLATDKSVNEW